jgi:hypothetical protein
MHRAFVVKAHRHRAPNVFAEHDDGGFGAGAWRLSVGVVRFRKFAVLILIECAGTLLLGGAPRGFDSDKLRPRGDLAVDMRRHLRLEARRVKALVALHVRSNRLPSRVLRRQRAHRRDLGLRPETALTSSESPRR